MPDCVLRLLIDAGDDEALEPLSAPVEDAECGIAGSRQLGCGLDDPLQDGVERQLGRERDARIEESTESIGLRHGGRIIPP
jgi:hypothetical protein